MRRHHLALALISAGMIHGHDARAQTVELAPGITFEVVELRRQADKGVMELKFAVGNASAADTTLADHGLALPHQLAQISVIDFAGRKQYDIGSASTCLCSTFQAFDGGVVRAGERREFWAWYGLPPEGLKQAAIKMGNQPPIMNVPVK